MLTVGWRGLLVAYVGLGDFNGYSPRADIAKAVSFVHPVRLIVFVSMENIKFELNGMPMRVRLSDGLGLSRMLMPDVLVISSICARDSRHHAIKVKRDIEVWCK